MISKPLVLMARAEAYRKWYVISNYAADPPTAPKRLHALQPSAMDSNK